MAKISIRVPDEDLATIDSRADELGVSRTALMLRSVLGVTTSDTERFDGIEQRLGRLEQLSVLGS